MKFWQVFACALVLAFALLIAAVVDFEQRTSTIQAKFFSTLASQLTYSVKPGLSRSIRFPSWGPYDIRLGYTRLPFVVSNLIREGYRVEHQVEMSPRLVQLIDLGVFPIYKEKTRTGLLILDQNKEVIYSFNRPEKIFKTFEQVPKLIVDSLLFIENREILDVRYPLKNPAVEWDRLGKAVMEKAVQELYPEHSAPGGSTIATQLEKYRHGHEGRTRTARDKLQQMVSASTRAYLDGPETIESRRQIVLNYLNSIPLAALPGYGEVNGLGDGLWAWYGTDLEQLSAMLNIDDEQASNAEMQKKAHAFKQVLSLFISHRRPSHFLLTDVSILNSLVDDYLQLLSAHGVISEKLRDAALQEELQLRTSAPPPMPISFLDRKAANAIRTRLLATTGITNLYELDQIDLSVQSTLDRQVQDRVTEALRLLKDREVAEKYGLTGHRSLDRGDPAKVIYSVTLYEHVAGMNLLRVQTDNYDKPFSINEGTKLDLGSTAKLRVVTNYLEIVAQLFEEYSDKSPAELKTSLGKVSDPISKWLIELLTREPQISLEKALEEAMSRKYSANPGESFFTGGGLHTFNNFKKEDNGRIVTISEAVQQSINLPFVRLMRDLVRYYMAQIPGSPTRSKDKANEAARLRYLEKFADSEGSYFLEHFYLKYRNLKPEELLATLIKGVRVTPARLAVMFRYVRPYATVADLNQFLAEVLPKSEISLNTVKDLYEKYGPGNYSLQDQGYIARVHPLELWLVGYLERKPQAKFKEIQEASKNERQEVYGWLFKTRHRHAQDKRIRALIEFEAFVQMHQAWKRLGYPFDSLVPSYATAIGSSGDRPVALAELIGVILNDGVRFPMVRMDNLHFAANTPYETLLTRKPSAGVRVLKAEVARVVRRALVDVVENGTARRVSKAYLGADGKPLVIGGKTGTGDHRYDTFGKGGQLISSRVVNRTATFAFFIGERHFGVVTAHVQGEDAADYGFTSALAAGLLKALAPALNPLIK